MSKQVMQLINRFSLTRLLKLWHKLNGEAAYERYLAHWQALHAETDERPLSRKAFFADETQRKWNGIKRCC
ncbi:YbdD/YjiX family protein [Methylomonas lenta]|nr:YbdD/YjiX family protein [Methylomonas lenta]